MPYGPEVLEMISERVERPERVRERMPVPFLLENNVYSVDLPERGTSDPEFLNAPSPRSGCGGTAEPSLPNPPRP